MSGKLRMLKSERETKAFSESWSQFQHLHFRTTGHKNLNRFIYNKIFNLELKRASFLEPSSYIMVVEIQTRIFEGSLKTYVANVTSDTRKGAQDLKEIMSDLNVVSKSLIRTVPLL